MKNVKGMKETFLSIVSHSSLLDYAYKYLYLHISDNVDIIIRVPEL